MRFIYPQWKIQYQKIIKYFILDLRLDITDCHITGTIFGKIANSPYRIDRDTVDKVLKEITRTSNAKHKSQAQKNSYHTVLSYLYWNWKEKHPGKNTIDWLMKGMKNSGLSIKKENLEEFIKVMEIVDVGM